MMSSGFAVERALLPLLYESELRAAPGTATLLARYRHQNGTPSWGPSQWEDNLAKAIGCHDHFYYEDYRRGLFGDATFVQRIHETRPSVLFLSSYDCFSPLHPRIEVIRRLRAYGIRVAAVWWDSTSKLALRQCLAMRDAVDLHILIDSSALEPHCENSLRLWAPVDAAEHVGAAVRDIPISFVGSVAGYRSIRSEYLEHAKAAGIDVLTTGGPGEAQVSAARYAEILGRSEISINFSHSVEGTHQLKARVLEVMFSGALLMESDNTETSRYFEPMHEYVPFGSKQELADKLRYFSSRPNERAQIAERGRAKAIALFGAQSFKGRLESRLI